MRDESVRIWRVIGEPDKPHPGMATMTLGTFGSQDEAEAYLSSVPASRNLEKFLLASGIHSLRVSVYEHPIVT